MKFDANVRKKKAKLGWHINIQTLYELYEKRNDFIFTLGLWAVAIQIEIKIYIFSPLANSDKMFLDKSVV